MRNAARPRPGSTRRPIGRVIRTCRPERSPPRAPGSARQTEPGPPREEDSHATSKRGPARNESRIRRSRTGDSTPALDGAAVDGSLNPNFARFTPQSATLTLGGHVAVLSNPQIQLTNDNFSGIFDAIRFQAGASLFGTPLSFSAEQCSNTRSLTTATGSDWRGPGTGASAVAYQLDAPFTILSRLAGATVSNGNTRLSLPAASFDDGILRFGEPIASLSVDVDSTAMAEQAITFAVVPEPGLAAGLSAAAVALNAVVRSRVRRSA